MRLRKKKWSPEVFEEYAAITSKVDGFEKTNWKEKLNTESLVVEIGSGKGDYWHQMAKLFPEKAFIAMEKDYTACAIALKKCEEYPEKNKHLIYGDASRLTDLFADRELSAIHLNFSDPWPKKRHERRRLTHPDKLKDYHQVLEGNGLLILKTDNVSLFNYSVVSIGQNGFEMIECDVDFRSHEHDDPFTEYERKFTQLGQAIYRGIWRKK